MNFSECLMVKIAHDLAGGIGALSSTVDLMKFDPTFVNEAPEMMKKNTDMLLARLKFYRALFGAETKSISESIVLDYLDTLGAKITFSGKISNRLELSMIAVGIQMAAAGGDILYSNNTLTISSNNLILNENIIKILSGNIPKESKIETLEAEWLIKQLTSQNHSLKMIQKNKKIELKVI